MKPVLSLLLLAFFAGSLTADWEHFGLAEHNVYDLVIYEDHLYAATDNGIYSKALSDPDYVWLHIGLEGDRITSLTILDPYVYLAGFSYPDSDHPVMRSQDAGYSWEPYSEGINYELFFQTNSFAHHPANPNTIFATGVSYVIRRDLSAPYWELVAGDWSGMAMGYHFVEIHPEDHNLIWVGGEYASFIPFLLRSYDGGENWTEIILDAIVGGDNACQSLAFDPYDDQVLYVGMEGRIIKSSDGGGSWAVVMTSECDIWGVAVSEYDNRIVYASSHGRSIYEDLLLYISADGGENWYTVNGGFGRRMTYALAYRSLEKWDEIYAGTIGDGVFKFTNSFGEVSTDDVLYPPENLITLCNYPNPFNNRTMIELTIPEEAEVVLSVYSIKGIRVTEFYTGILSAGKFSFAWDGTDSKGNLLPSGIYLILLEQKGVKIAHKMLLLK